MFLAIQSYQYMKIYMVCMLGMNIRFDMLCNGIKRNEFSY